ncbi:MAG: C1 family peptidase [Ferruginibacter sp.]
MKRIISALILVSVAMSVAAQPSVSNAFIVEKKLAATPVKNQAMTGTCWCFSATSLVESQCLKNNLGELDLSEMFTVRNIYIEKAKNYILRQGHAQFGEGGLGHDLVRAIGTYGAEPESVYSGLKENQKNHNHVQLIASLQSYLDSTLKHMPVADNWFDGYVKILDAALGTPPATFEYMGKSYTSKTFATQLMKFNPDDFVNITSFTHQPYYKPFILQVPDNFSNAAYYNLPLNEMTKLVEDAVSKGYSVMWDADVSNNGFHQEKGLALLLDEKEKYESDAITADLPEMKWDIAKRQQLYEDLTTQDDHLMHITGIEKSKSGKTFFIVKNSWGVIGPDKGYINVSEAYFSINTVSLVVPKAAISTALLTKLGIK